MDNLEAITDAIREEFEARNSARDDALRRSRNLIRHCGNTIRAIHRRQWDQADAGLQTVREAAVQMVEGVADYPDLYHAGFTQDALKEYVEAFSIYALVRGGALPTPGDLGVPGSTYLNGLAEAASELRRHILDIIRKTHSAEVETYLDAMDTIYDSLMTFDFPDGVTGGLRRRVDQLRGVLERTRGDVSSSLRQHQLRQALTDLERRLGEGSGQR